MSNWFWHLLIIFKLSRTTLLCHFDPVLISFNHDYFVFAETFPLTEMLNPQLFGPMNFYIYLSKLMIDDTWVDGKIVLDSFGYLHMLMNYLETLLVFSMLPYTDILIYDEVECNSCIDTIYNFLHYLIFEYFLWSIMFNLFHCVVN